MYGSFYKDQMLQQVLFMNYDKVKGISFSSPYNQKQNQVKNQHTIDIIRGSKNVYKYEYGPLMSVYFSNKSSDKIFQYNIFFNGNQDLLFKKKLDAINKALI